MHYKYQSSLKHGAFCVLRFAFCVLRFAFCVLQLIRHLRGLSLLVSYCGVAGAPLSSQAFLVSHAACGAPLSVITGAVNGQQHSTSYFVCGPRHYGVAQEDAPAPAAGGAAWDRPLFSLH